MAKSGSRLMRAALLVALCITVLAVLISAWTVIRSHNGGQLSAVGPRGTNSAPARAAASGSSVGVGGWADLTILVTDEHQPLVDATVRLMSRNGNVVVMKTGGGGIAHAERLEPGIWQISASADGHLPAGLPAQKVAPGRPERLALRLASGGRTLHGTVSDTSGGPITGARIEASKLTLIALPGDAVSTTLTADDGTYHMTVTEGSLLVAVTSPDYAPQSRRIEVGPAGGIANFSLVPGGVIEGVVRDERTDEPVADAHVRGQRNPGTLYGAERHVVAGADGRFRLTGLKPGDWQLDAAAPPRYGRNMVHVGLAVGEQVSGLELRIGTSAAVRGRVIDEQGVAAPDVEVRAIISGSTTTATADTKGTFVIEGLRPGNYILSAKSTSYLSDKGTNVSLADRDIDDVVVRVARGLVLKGHVEPRQPCHVQHEADAATGRALNLVPDVTTGPDGEFELRPFSGGTAKLVARCISGNTGELRVDVGPASSEVVIHVAAGSSLAGRVVNGDGQAVPGVSVFAYVLDPVTGAKSGPLSGTFRMSEGLVTSGAQTLTDATGAFRISSLSPGSYGFEVLDRGRLLEEHKPFPEPTVGAGEHKSGLELAVESAGGVISGTVSSPDGTPLADAWVSAYPEPTASDIMNLQAGTSMMSFGPGGANGSDPAPAPVLTDAEGRYAVTNLFHARYTVVAEGKRGQLLARESNVIPSIVLNLKTHGIATLVGTVTSRDLQVAMITVALRGPTVADRSFTQPDFTFDHINPGNYTIYVETALGGGQAAVTVAPGDTARIAINLSANGAVAGRLVDSAGNPLDGRPVVVARDDDRPGDLIRAPTTTGADGRFRIDHAPGPCLLFVDRQPQRPFIKRGLMVESRATLDLGAIVLDRQANPPQAPAPPSTSPGAAPSNIPRRLPHVSARQ